LNIEYEVNAARGANSADVIASFDGIGPNASSLALTLSPVQAEAIARELWESASEAREIVHDMKRKAA
jgi:hypothetical protein